MADEQTPPRRGYRKDGNPYKDNNTRPDGSYEIGKGRPDTAHQFRAGDGRKRGPRPRGSKNLVTEWNEELNAKIWVAEGPVRKKVTKRRSLIKTQIERGQRGSDRAAETAFHYAQLGERPEAGPKIDDFEMIASYLATLNTGDSYDVALGLGQPAADHDSEGDGVTGDA